ncbi:MAG: hypothetical protein HY722_00095 [Planctomycetes bacterium]|nr:hypothetical protein [Planctomycetota bacterium]
MTRRRRRFALVLAALGLGLAVGAYVLLRTRVGPFLHLQALFGDSALARERPAGFEARLAADMVRLAAYRGGLERVAAELAALRREVPAEAASLGAPGRRRLKDVWASLLDYHIGCEDLKVYYQGFPGVPSLDPGGNEWRHSRAFAIAFLIHLLQVDSAREFIDPFLADRDWEAILDEADPGRGIPAGCYGRLKLRVLHLQTLAEVSLLAAYHDGPMRGHYRDRRAAAPDAPDAWVEGAIDRLYPRVKAWYREEGAAQILANAQDVVTEDLFARWFPLQKEVAEWMGDTRLKGRAPLIARSQVQEMQPALEPGDIILERRNGYLSNVGLPGFWPHAALYLGTPEELARFMDGDPEVRAGCVARGATGVLDLVRALRPVALAAWAGDEAAHGDPPRVIEAVSEGVVFSSLEHSCDADYVALLRPRLTRLERLGAITAALGHWGKAYDFNFDFVTDDTIVCSELVWKAYQPDAGRRGLDFPLKEVLGRRVFPAHEFAMAWLQGLASGQGPLDLVWLLDGREAEGGAVRGTEEDFRASCARARWAILRP